jgi:hypothetical protein
MLGLKGFPFAAPGGTAATISKSKRQTDIPYWAIQLKNRADLRKINLFV